MSEVYIGYANEALILPQSTTGLIKAENLARPEVSAKSLTFASPTTISFDFGVNKTLDVHAMAGLEINGSADIVFKYSTISAGNTDAGSFTYSGVTLPAGFHTFARAMPSQVTARYMQVSITNCVAVGLVWASKAFSPRYGIQPGLSVGWEDLSEKQRSSLSGVTINARRPKLRTVSFGFSHIENDEVDTLDEIDRLSGTTEQILLIPGTPGLSNDRINIIGQFERLDPITKPNFDLQEKAYTIIESK